jgi:UDPglucose--hexose-1-phosphate uridylyltransferase
MDFSRTLRNTLKRLSTVLNNPPYNYILYTAPNRVPRSGQWHTLKDDFHWHLEIIPRITRTAGFEWGSGFYINPTPPEDAARYLREVKP